MLSFDLFLVIGVSYFLGAVPFGLVFTKMAGLGDIREVGSGNIGATNVLRTGRKDLALATLLLDAGKGAIAVLVTRYYVGADLAAIAGTAAFVGHCFPIYLGFKGGKGFATFMGTLFAIAPYLGLAAGATWLLSAAIFRMSSLAALVTAALSPIFSYFIIDSGTWPAIGFMTFVIFLRHKDNISRIIKGEEAKLGKKDKS